jgi:hypothetical protein
MYWTLVSIDTLVSVGEDRIAHDHVARRPDQQRLLFPSVSLRTTAWNTSLVAEFPRINRRDGLGPTRVFRPIEQRVLAAVNAHTSAGIGEKKKPEKG